MPSLVSIYIVSEYSINPSLVEEEIRKGSAQGEAKEMDCCLFPVTVDSGSTPSILPGHENNQRNSFFLAIFIFQLKKKWPQRRLRTDLKAKKTAIKA